MAIRSLNENGQSIDGAKGRMVATDHKRSKTGMILLLIFIVLLAGIILYFFFAPTVCPVRYLIQNDIIYAPTNAQLTFVAPPGKIQKGQLLAELMITSGSGSSFLGQIQQIDERIRFLRKEEHIQNNALAQMKRNILMLQHELIKAESELQVLVQTKNHAQKMFDLYQRKFENAQRLFHLDAIRKSECDYLEELYHSAENELKKLELQYRGKVQMTDSLKRQILLEEKVYKHNEEVLSSFNAGNAVLIRQLEDQMKNMEFIPGGLKLKIYALHDGFVASGGPRADTYISSGDVMITILSRKNECLGVYVPANIANQITESTTFKVAIGGRTFQTGVKLLSMNMITLPNSLKNTKAEPNSLYCMMELKMPPDSISLFNGQTGSAIIDKE